MRLPIAHSGVLIGTASDPDGDPDGGPAGDRPVVANLLRELPTQVGVFGGGRAALLVVFRALAFGARAVVLTRDPGWWATLRQAVPGPEWLSVQPPRSPVPVGGSALAPSVVVDDTGVAPDGLRRGLGPWQTVLTISHGLTGPAVAALRQFDLIIAERLTSRDADAIVAGCGLPEVAGRWLARLSEQQLALVAPGRLRLATVAPTAAERTLR
jgi:hypothetical protein